MYAFVLLEFQWQESSLTQTVATSGPCQCSILCPQKTYSQNQKIWEGIMELLDQATS